MGDPSRFAVVDVETTGFSPRTDRIVEVAVVSMTDDRTVIDEYTTLVNPGRDVGPTRVHGIEASHVAHAPAFRDVAGDLAARLEGRVLVAHNARFDEDFLRAEFARAGASVPSLSSICTLQLAHQLDPDAASRKLHECCARAGIELTAHHHAIHDARATARLFDAYLTAARARSERGVAQMIAAAAALVHPPWEGVPGPTGRILPREAAAGYAQAQRDYIARLVTELPGDESPSPAEGAYLDMLDRALLDRVLEPSESQALLEEAARYGLSTSHVHACHHLYLRSLVRQALADGVVTKAERADLHAVAQLLGVARAVVDALEQGLAAKVRPAAVDGPMAGRVVCFTGEFSMPREEAATRARERGVVVTDSVTKKTHLVVAADPTSQSGKAKKARDYGLPVISEVEFWTALGA